MYPVGGDIEYSTAAIKRLLASMKPALRLPLIGGPLPLWRLA